VRYAGVDRYATAVDIADRGLGNPSKLLLATGASFPDALATLEHMISLVSPNKSIAYPRRGAPI